MHSLHSQSAAAAKPAKPALPGVTSRVLRMLICVLLLFCALQGSGADPYGAALDQLGSAPAANVKKAARDEKAAAIEQAIVEQVKSLAQAPEPVRPPVATGPSDQLLVMTIVVGLAAVFVLARRVRAWVNAPDAVTALLQDRCAPEFLASFEKLAKSIALESVPATTPGTGKAAVATGAPARQGAAPGESAPGPRAKTIARMGKLIAEMERGAHQMWRLDLVGDLCAESSALKNGTSGPEFLPLWQMASALDAFLKQTFCRQSTITPGMIRTLAEAHEVLQALCKTGAQPDLTVKPPIRLLAVDDDEVSRLAVEMALTKALQQPDLASDGTAALELAKAEKYDVVFADVEMPGMGGFELCSKLRQSDKNAATPVVFVSIHTDSETHSRGMAAGGNGFLTKPFGILELSLKALTLVIAHRLQLPSASDASKKEATPAAPPTAPEPALA